MLMLTRSEGDKIYLMREEQEQEIVFLISEIYEDHGKMKVKVGVEADKEWAILRHEVIERSDFDLTRRKTKP